MDPAQELHAEEVQERTYLTEREAQVYILREEEGMTHAETAEALPISEGNVKSKWANIRKKVHDAEDDVEKAENTADLL